MDNVQNDKSAEGHCPLLEFPCPRGEARADECCLRFTEGFDPMHNERDLEMLKCAARRAELFHESTIKFWY